MMIVGGEKQGHLAQLINYFKMKSETIIYLSLLLTDLKLSIIVD